MIRYEVTPAEIYRRVDAEKPGWRARASLKTEAFRARGSYDKDESPIWSEIKKVFIDIQERKCAFCERPLDSKKEYDIEHFRPKSSVKPWKVSAELMAAGVKVSQTTIKEPGYHLLPYNLLNYSVACAKCNSELKSDCFPIRGTRDSTGEDPAAMQYGEQAWLIFPIGGFDDDPENLITFFGFSPQAAALVGCFKYQRALLTIEFFRLDDRNVRRELYRARADVIQKMGFAFRMRDAVGTPATMIKQCQAIIDYHQSPAAPHTSCGRAYAKLWRTDRAAAEQLWGDTVDFLQTISPPKGRSPRK